MLQLNTGGNRGCLQVHTNGMESVFANVFHQNGNLVLMLTTIPEKVIAAITLRSFHAACSSFQITVL